MDDNITLTVVFLVFVIPIAALLGWIFASMKRERLERERRRERERKEWERAIAQRQDFKSNVRSIYDEPGRRIRDDPYRNLIGSDGMNHRDLEVIAALAADNSPRLRHGVDDMPESLHVGGWTRPTHVEAPISDSSNYSDSSSSDSSSSGSSD